MSRKRRTIKSAIVFFCALAVIFIMGATSIALKLPKKISQMNEIKAAVAELEESKKTQEKQLEDVVNEMDEMSTQIQSMQESLQKAKEEGLDVDEDAGDSEENGVKYAYLTFDDGPSENTIKILDFLKANNIKATFFVIGKDGYDDVYKRIVDEGHTLAVHSNTHVYSDIYLSVYAFMKDINTLASRMEKITGVQPSIMRFPGGSNNTVSHKYGGDQIMDKIIAEVTKEGYIYFDWNVDSSDATANCKDKNSIFNAVMNGVQGKEHAIILMHDAAAKTSTAAALPQIVEGLRKKGFVFEAITEQTPLVQFK